MTQPLAIVRVGMLSPVGLDAEQTTASLWAGVPGKSETSIMDRQFEPFVLGHLPHEVLPPLVEPLDAPPLSDPRPRLTALQRRLLRLLGPALAEVLEAAVEPNDPDAPVGSDEPRYECAALPKNLDPLPPLLLAGPRPEPTRPEIMTDRFIGDAILQAGVPLDPATSRVFASGHAGLFAAIAHAQASLGQTQRGPQLAVIGGVDSYVDPYRLALLEQDDRVLTRGLQDAFTPGEAAAVMLVATERACRVFGYSPLAWIDSVGLGHEAGCRYGNGSPHRGDGLADAVRGASEARAAGAEPIRLVMAGSNGERGPVKEWGTAQVRNQRLFSESYRFEHFAEYVGDSGAASAALMLGATALAFGDRKAYASVDGPALVWASSDFGDCGALVLRAA